jgi:hypothetical protein
MKKLLVLMLFLSMAALANATMFITVNGIVNPPDSTVTIVPSTTLIIGVWNDGQTGISSFALGVGALSDGPGSLDASRVVLPFGGTAVMSDNALTADALGIQTPFVSLEIGGYQGLAATDVVFHCDGEGDVTLYLVDNDGEVADSQVIHQIPEPMTIALLGLGGLLLRRKTA